LLIVLNKQLATRNAPFIAAAYLLHNAILLIVGGIEVSSYYAFMYLTMLP